MCTGEERAMRKARTLVSLAALVGSVGAAGTATAQVDVNPPLPNVMMLVDSSGSMEYKSSSAAFPTCVPTGPGSERSRWIELLGGHDWQHSRLSLRRSESRLGRFQERVQLERPTAAGRRLPQPLPSAPFGQLHSRARVCCPPNAYDYPAGAVNYHAYTDPNIACNTFSQASDGLLDSFGSSVRFGLMTFDPHTSGGTGVSGTTPNYTTGVNGTWSYFLNAQPKQGKPAACSTLSSLEVGARNAAAPPWEGRMVSFGASNASGATLATKNAQIQEILLATRPYGATPIAGMLDDVRDFLWNDTSTDPLIPADDFGPYRDPYITGGCRNNFVVLLSDGEPNLDLRPFCEGAGPPAGVCPYSKPEDISFDLANAADPNKRTKVFVIGFAVSNVTLSDSTPVDCENLTDPDLNSPTGTLRDQSERARAAGVLHPQPSGLQRRNHAGILCRRQGRTARGALGSSVQHREEYDQPHHPRIRLVANRQRSLRRRLSLSSAPSRPSSSLSGTACWSGSATSARKMRSLGT